MVAANNFNNNNLIMNRLFILMSVLALSVSCHARSLAVAMRSGNLPGKAMELLKIEGIEADDYTFQTIDPQFEWSQFKNKTAAALLLKDQLTLLSKKDEQQVFSIVELPLNTESDSFVFGALFLGPKLNESTSLGIIFDYSDSRNYKGISISKDQYRYFISKDGVVSDIKTGLIKYKGKEYYLQMKKDGDKATFSLNGLEMGKLNKIAIESPFFGVMFQGKGATQIPYFNFYVEIPNDEEQSTTDK